ncbi:MAG: alpha/beta fold hydrolase [Alphaproteobacteria bacterium]
MLFPITEHIARTDRHTSFYLACGPEDGPLIIFVHGWPELSISWRHQLPVFGALGFRAVAPDMRGYGRSSIYDRHEDYMLRHSVDDMMELLEHLGRDKAVWVGHDWGSPVVWAIGQHDPERCHGIASLCVPYLPEGLAPETAAPLADKKVYPDDQFPVAQWDYMLFYRENFAAAEACFAADPGASVRALFRSGNPDGRGKPAPLAFVRAHGGWFRGAPSAPSLPRDPLVLTAEDESRYTAALARTGFFGPGSWYMNAPANKAFAETVRHRWTLDMPVLFLHGAHDFTCETMDSAFAEPMRAYCRALTEAVVPSGHWMAQEKPVHVNAALTRWLGFHIPDLWDRA